VCLYYRLFPACEAALRQGQGSAELAHLDPTDLNCSDRSAQPSTHPLALRPKQEQSPPPTPNGRKEAAVMGGAQQVRKGCCAHASSRGGTQQHQQQQQQQQHWQEALGAKQLQSSSLDACMQRKWRCMASRARAHARMQVVVSEVDSFSARLSSILSADMTQVCTRTCRRCMAHCVPTACVRMLVCGGLGWGWGLVMVQG